MIEAVYLAGALTKVQAGYALTSMVNATNEVVEIDEPLLRVTEIEPSTPPGPPQEVKNGP